MVHPGAGFPGEHKDLGRSQIVLSTTREGLCPHLRCFPERRAGSANEEAPPPSPAPLPCSPAASGRIPLCAPARWGAPSWSRAPPSGVPAHCPALCCGIISGGWDKGRHEPRARWRTQGVPLAPRGTEGRKREPTCMQLVNMTQTDIILEKIFSSSGLVSMQSFKQLSRKLVW